MGLNMYIDFSLITHKEHCATWGNGLFTPPLAEAGAAYWFPAKSVKRRRLIIHDVTVTCPNYSHADLVVLHVLCDHLLHQRRFAVLYDPRSSEVLCPVIRAPAFHFGQRFHISER